MRPNLNMVFSVSPLINLDGGRMWEKQAKMINLFQLFSIYL